MAFISLKFIFDVVFGTYLLFSLTHETILTGQRNASLLSIHDDTIMDCVSAQINVRLEASKVMLTSDNRLMTDAQNNF